MRTIKFRAWDKNSKTMLYVGENPLWADTTGKLIDSFEDEDLMQFTGLLEKNGKEIYEGDIVKDLDNNLISVIEWEKAGYMQRIRIAYETLDGKDYRKHDYENAITGLAYGRGLEVISNIYENPELIKK